MFSEYLREHPFMQTLKAGPYVFFPPAGDRDAWQGLGEAATDGIEALWAGFRDKPYPVRLATGFLAYVRNGSRKADEEPYFFRRRKLCAAGAAYCAGHEEALDEIIDGVWAISEETSWVISAHNVNPIPGAPKPSEYPLPDGDRPYIDLFSAQTGMILSLTESLCGEALDAVTPMLRQRIHRELDKRILTPFMEDDTFWWMGFIRKDLCNWTPWIVSNVMLTACLRGMGREALSGLLTRACGMLDRWLDVVPEDGGCDEGAGYWNMAGGALADCLELFETVTGGIMTFWHVEKVHNILLFPARVELGGGWFVNFADCDARPYISGERIQYAGERMGDKSLAAMGARLRGEAGKQLSDVPHFSRMLKELFRPRAQAGEKKAPEDTWLPDLQVRVVRRGEMILAAKGGHNGESHNHNDVGSFILCEGGEPQIVDAGNMTYTAKTFSSERYTLWNTRSAYHNVPLIRGQEQRPGAEYAARDTEYLPDGLRLDMAGAYDPSCGAKRWTRTLELNEAGLTVRDEGDMNGPGEVTWVFMLRHEPAVREGTVEFGRLRMALPDGARALAEEVQVTDERMAATFPGSLWRLKVTMEDGGAPTAEFKITY